MTDRPILFKGSMVRAILDGKKTQTRRILKWPKEAHLHGRSPRPDNERCFGDTAGFFGGSEDFKYFHAVYGGGDLGDDTMSSRIQSPYAREEGDKLWVRETFVLENTSEYIGDYDLPKDRPNMYVEDPDQGCTYHLIPHYHASEPEPHIVPLDLEDSHDDRTRWKPSIFMPRWASRITLNAIGSRPERLQDITDEDAIAEGLAKITKDNGRTWKYGIPDRDGLPGTDDDGWPWHEWSTSPREAFFKLWDSINKKRGFGVDTNPWVWVTEWEPYLGKEDDVK